MEKSTSGSATIPASLLTKVRALPEVKAAAGTGRRPRSTRPTSSAGTAKPSPRRAGREHRFRQRALQPAETQDRRVAGGDRAGRDRRRHRREAALRARRLGARLDARHPASYRITGTASYGDVDSLGFSSVAIWDVKTAQALLDREGRFDTISIAAKNGTSAAELVDAVRPVIPATLRPRTAQTAEEASAEADKGIA